MGYLIYKIRAIFTGIETIHFIRMVCDINICLMIAVIDSPVAPTYRGTDRHTDIQDIFPVMFILDWSKIERGIHFIFVIDRCNEIEDRGWGAAGRQEPCGG